nr:hypothetical protein [Nitrosomonas sp.]
MSKRVIPVLLGRPQFLSGELAALAAKQGDFAAWQQLITTSGWDAVKSVAGDFAVGFHDAAGRAFLAVDRFAIRSLCYRVDGGQLRFAARADELADESTEIDPQAIFDYLYFHIIPSPRTIFKEIYRLPPGHYAIFENGEIKVLPYWVAEFVEQPNPSFEELRTEF